jgi:enamine deaminase RidA (YjgF/YER057c/UK114 family)
MGDLPGPCPPGGRYIPVPGICNYQRRRVICWHNVFMVTFRQTVSSGSPLEPTIGMSRAVRSGPYVSVAGTAPISEGGGVEAPGDVYAQSVRCLDIVERALVEAGASLKDVIRNRVMLTDIENWREAARAHAERFGEIRPACTFVEVSRFIDSDWLVEFEVDAVIDLARP